MYQRREKNSLRIHLETILRFNDYPSDECQ
ncbi:hypothetical protein CUBM_gp64c [Staphylococcus phage CUB-M]|nr:MAG: hypothetical protein [Staphylococcus phage RP2]UPO38609.1 hypothetical protein [Staphylococcus phage vB_SaS_GE1]WMT38693.1 hypothetical protein [Staphylococcus phage Sp2021]WPH67223.1 hypothetical protein CUBM_gp64c [Staphylococcus phage CUB-M]